MSSSDPANSQIVKLNIGGYKYMTTKGTLCKQGDCYFTALLGGKYSALKDEEGFYFVDRDGEYFKPILSFLRTGELEVPHDMSYNRILREAEYYNIILPEIEPEESESNNEPKSLLKFNGIYVSSDLCKGLLFLDDKNVLVYKSNENVMEREVYHYPMNELQIAFEGNFFLLDKYLINNTMSFDFYTEELPKPNTDYKCHQDKKLVLALSFRSNQQLSIIGSNTKTMNTDYHVSRTVRNIPIILLKNCNVLVAEKTNTFSLIYCFGEILVACTSSMQFILART
jgi:hypothetical protein